MFEQEFDAVKNFLRSKLADYLKSKGINTDARFSCLNPEDHSTIASMSYDKNSFTVKCFNCGAVYDIFDLIGADYGLPDFISRFRKAHEIFIGSVPISYLELLKKEEDQNSIYADNNSEPVFEIAKDTAISKKDAGLAIKPVSAVPKFTAAKAFAPSNSVTQNAFTTETKSQKQVIGPSLTPNQCGSFGSFRTTSQFSPSSFNFSEQPRPITQTKPFAFSEQSDETSYDFTEYLKSCALKISQTDYFKQRGLTDEVIKKFDLGYDDRFLSGVDQLGGQHLWKAAIIPYGSHGYCARNIEAAAKDPHDRFKKKGICDIFNREALSQAGEIFITEGEFDALSFESLGFRAVAVGGASNIRPLIEHIKKMQLPYLFHICFDNDAPGRDAALILADALRQLKISCDILNLAYPYKDANEALCSIPKVFKERLAKLPKLLALHIESAVFNPLKLYRLGSLEDLLNLNLSGALYSLCGNPQVLRLALSEILNFNQKPVLYAGNCAQWQYLNEQISPCSPIFSNQQASLLHFMEISSELDVPCIENYMTAALIRGQQAFISVIDLTGCTQKQCQPLYRELSGIAKHNSLPILVLCPSECSSLAASFSLQNFDIILSPQGHLICNTIDAAGKPAAIILRKGN